MDKNDVLEWLNLAFRWIHVIAGIMWIGHLWFFNFVNSQVAKAYDPESKKKILPVLMPRALYFFRWGAAYTFLSGLLLFIVVYTLGGALASSMGSHAATGVILVVFVAGFGIYDVLWKQIKDETIAAVVSFVLLTALSFGLSRFIEGRGLFIAIGGLLGTIMAANVWMRIWPNQRKIISGVTGAAPAPPADVPALAGLRSKHNTYLSMPLVFFMISSHFASTYGNANYNWAVAMVFVLVGCGIAKFLYVKAASAAPGTF